MAFEGPPDDIQKAMAFEGSDMGPPSNTRLPYDRCSSNKVYRLLPSQGNGRHWKTVPGAIRVRLCRSRSLEAEAGEQRREARSRRCGDKGYLWKGKREAGEIAPGQDVECDLTPAADEARQPSNNHTTAIA